MRQAAVLFAEGVAISARPSHSEWTRFEQLSGGQKVTAHATPRRRPIA